jgi:hypothetical protein
VDRGTRLLTCMGTGLTTRLQPAKGTNYSVCYHVHTDFRVHLDSSPLPFSRELQNTWYFPSTPPPPTRVLGAVNSSRAANFTFTFHKGAVSAGMVHSASWLGADTSIERAALDLTLIWGRSCRAIITIVPVVPDAATIRINYISLAVSLTN